MQPLYYLLTFIAGALLTIQVGMNSTLGRVGGNMRFAVLVSFLVGTVGLLVYFAASGTAVPTRASLASVPAWAWFGGCLGAFYVAIATVVGPRIGAAALLALAVFGQLCASLLVDQFGWLGFPLRPISPTKIAGVALLLGGVGLIVR
jgi:bacterial/archaeal transporter family-2 protein